MARIRYSGSEVRREVITTLNSLADDAKMKQEISDHVTPPSGKRAGVDKMTEINGFRQDADAVLVQPMLAEFAGGATQEDIARFLKAKVDGLETRAESAGPFLVEAADRLMKHLAPDVLAAAAPPEKPLPADQFAQAMAGYRDQEGLYSQQYLLTALKTIGQPDMLSERNIGRLLKAVESQADRHHDPDTMGYYCDDVNDHMKAVFEAGSAAYKAQLDATPAAATAPPTTRPSPDRKAG